MYIHLLYTESKTVPTASLPMQTCLSCQKSDLGLEIPVCSPLPHTDHDHILTMPAKSAPSYEKP